MKRTVLAGLLTCLSFLAYGQQTEDARQYIAELLEPLAEKDLLKEDYSELLDDLVFLFEHPLNVNTVTKEELERIPFLNDYQIENLLFYIYNNGPLLTIYEQNAVEGLKGTTIQQMIPFLRVAPVTEEKQKQYLGGEFIVRGQSTIQEPIGYQSTNDSIPPKYLGSKERLYARTQCYLGEKWSAGLTLEKDPGEAFFSNGAQGVDFVSAYLMFKPGKVLRKIILGDFQASFGQGLGLWSGQAFSKSAESDDIRRRGRGLDKYASVNENSFMRGMAVEFTLHKLTLYAFGSYRERDATITDLSSISSIREDGYHRTLSELEARNSVGEKMGGLVLAYQARGFKVEGGHTYWAIDRTLLRGPAVYQAFNFSGNNLSSSFASYSWFGPKLILFGEIGVQDYKHPAIYQGLTYSPGADVKLALSYRNYSRTYFNLYANPFSESSSSNGENGVYFGVSCLPLKKLTLKAYMDVFWYEWLKFRTDAPSSGLEFLVQTKYAVQNNLSVLFRMKSKQGVGNRLFSEDIECPVSNRHTFSVRGQLNYEPFENWWFQTRVEQVFFNEEEGHRAQGFLIFQDVKHTFANQRLTVTARVLHFDTDDYYSRIYTWEPDVLHAFSIPSFSGTGMRWLLNLSYKVNRHFQVWWRIANTYMPDVQEMGSGYNTIEGNNLTEVKLQLKYRF